LAIDAFVDFLKTYKTSSTDATEALEELNLDEEDGLSDEYDFMEDADGENAGRQQTRRRERHPKLKYMQLLQDISDRNQSNILIELDDLETVCLLDHLCEKNC
jgi:DNA replication licensing factor MCM7